MWPRTVAGGSSPISSFPSRIAVSARDSPLSRLPPGRPQVLSLCLELRKSSRAYVVPASFVLQVGQHMCDGGCEMHGRVQIKKEFPWLVSDGAYSMRIPEPILSAFAGTGGESKPDVRSPGTKSISDCSPAILPVTCNGCCRSCFKYMQQNYQPLLLTSDSRKSSSGLRVLLRPSFDRLEGQIHLACALHLASKPDKTG